MASFTTFNYGTGFGDFNESWQIGRTYTGSGSFVAPGDGWAWFVAIGAGGSGGAALEESGANCLSAGGGGAGGLCIKKLFVKKDAVYTITIGAGGVSRNRITSGTTAGAVGGDTTIIGPQLYLLASGGGAGNVASVANNGTNTNLNITGAVGGAAFGGDVNITGMPGGSVTITSGVANADAFSTGGGAVNIQSQIFTSNYSGTAATAALASSGIGVGGNGTTGTETSGASGQYPDGGGSGMGISLATPYNFFALQIDGGGGTGPGADAGSGGGGYGAAIGSNAGSSTITITAGAGGIFGGGGGATAVNTGGSSNSTANAAAGGRGAGGGGAAAYCTSAGIVNSGTGGSGLVLVFWGVGQ